MSVPPIPPGATPPVAPSTPQPALGLDALPSYDQHSAHALAYWCEETVLSAGGSHRAAREIVHRLGAFPDGEGRVLFGFWAPELLEKGIAADDAWVEIWRPVDPLSLTSRQQSVRFHRSRLPIAVSEEFAFTAAKNVAVGTRDDLGDFYWLRYRDRDGTIQTIVDYLAHSLPFGAFAPAEVYDRQRLDRERGDRDYWQSLAKADETVQMGPAANILQVHVPTGSASGTVAGLTRLFSAIAHKKRNDIPLETWEEPYDGYDAVQLLPVEPTIEYEGGTGFWEEGGTPDDGEPEVTVELGRPDCTNWGYDIVIAGSAALNPALLGSGRPDELVDLATVLHTFPGTPIKLIFDVVFGHADNQAVPLLSRHFFAGPNMYGQDLNYKHPVVRNIMLEMQRRKVDFGADGVRVDGAQDFKWWDAENQRLLHDDEYLREMALVEQEVAGCRYRPWMIFEDGRPWPQVDWELSSTYRAVIEAQADLPGETFQWGPLTFAHNTPFLFTFWMNKLWRIEEICQKGERWISGTANHDTLRRGYQVDPEKGINTRLGETLQDILDTAYDNPATNLFTYGVMPGVPMDFLNASMRASWAFIRNTDDKYGVKVVSEEAGFMTWQVDEDHFTRPGNFERLKAFAFTDDLGELRRFMKVLVTAVEATDYDLPAMAAVINAVEPALPGAPYTADSLKRFARAWMDDVHDYCNVAYYKDMVWPQQTHFGLALRNFRRERPWLRRNFGPDDRFGVIKPVDGKVVFYGYRKDPESREEVLMVAHMEGMPREVTPMALPIPGLDDREWTLALTAPSLQVSDLSRPVRMADSQGFLAVRKA